MSLVHCTQVIVVALQAGVPPPAVVHCMSVVHEATQRLVVVLQTIPVPQLPFVRHWTQSPAGEQWRPFVHCVSSTQVTHACAALQCGARVPTQLVSERHATQTLLAVSQ
jgi:hypothetical protein